VSKLKTAVLVISCDNYSDMWNPFFQLFWKRWPDCPYPVFLGTNHKSVHLDRVVSNPIGTDRTWTENLHLMLDTIDSSRVLVFLEDFLMIREVDTDSIDRVVKLAEQNDVGCLRLNPVPPPTRRLPGFPGIGEIQRGDDWRVSTQVAVWDVELLRSLAWPGLSAWEFETIGSLASDAMPDKFWSVYKPLIDYRNGVVLGRWMPEGLEICREAGVEVDLQSRRTVTEAEILANSRKKLRSLKGVWRAAIPESIFRSILRWRRIRWGEFYLNDLMKQAGIRRPDIPR
jgi:hypothetical protein